MPSESLPRTPHENPRNNQNRQTQNAGQIHLHTILRVTLITNLIQTTGPHRKYHLDQGHFGNPLHHLPLSSPLASLSPPTSHQIRPSFYMGNTNGREEGDNADGEDPSRRSIDEEADSLPGGVAGFPMNPDRPIRVGSSDSMGNSPPASPGPSRSPLMFAPQLPVAPLQRGDAPPIFNQMWMNDPQDTLDVLPEQGIPTMITWSSGGNNVFVEGSWDDWRSRKALQRSGKDHSILVVLPSGIYQYRFIVDGERRYLPDLPCITDEMGIINNLLDVHDYVPENFESIAEFEPPASPDSSYGQTFPGDEDFAKEPLAVPPQLHLTVLGTPNSAETSSKPQHVVLNHLFIEKGWASQSLVALGFTQRFQSKYVTVVLYKPLRR